MYRLKSKQQCGAFSSTLIGISEVQIGRPRYHCAALPESFLAQDADNRKVAFQDL